MRELDTEARNRRTGMFILILSLIFLFLIARLYYLQIVRGEEYEQKAERNSLRTNTIDPVRGKIYSKDGNLLVSNITGYQLVHKDSQNISLDELNALKEMFGKSEVERNQILARFKGNSVKKISEIYEDVIQMQEITDMDYNTIAERFYKVVPEGFDKEIVIDEDLDYKTALINSEKLKNERIDIVEYDKRYYHEKEIASHVIGYVKLINDKEYNELKNQGYNNNDLIGKDGIEKTYDKILKGSSGKEYVEVDARGNILTRLDEEKAVPGRNIYLSLNLELQKYMTEQFKGKTGTFIAIDVKTGKILSYVSYPEIDLNILTSRISSQTWEMLTNSSKTPLLNRGIAGLFPPGSTAKVVTAAALLEQGVIDTSTVYNSTGEFLYGRVKFRDSHRNGYGLTNIYKALSASVNTFFYNFILKADREKYFKLARDFGIGELTGVDIPGELSGVLPTPEWKKKKYKQSWLPGDLINMSIGQGYMLTTPLQVLMLYQAIANNGVLVKPTFVDYFESQNGTKTLKNPEVLRKLDVKDSTLKAIQTGLKNTVKDGTATSLANLPIEVSVKTGTAQNSKGLDHSWMAGYFPSNDPQIAIVALVENGGFGSVAAGSVVGEFVKKYYEVTNR